MTQASSRAMAQPHIRRKHVAAYYDAISPQRRRIVDKIVAAGYDIRIALAIVIRLVFCADGAWVFFGADDTYGYGQVRDGRKIVKVHRALCHAWHGPPPISTMDACHNDSKPENVHPDNLRWDTRSGNFKDKLTNGTHNAGESNVQSKLTEIAVRDIRAALRTGESQYSIARRHGVSRSCILSIHIGRAWRHVQI